MVLSLLLFLILLQLLAAAAAFLMLVLVLKQLSQILILLVKHASHELKLSRIDGCVHIEVPRMAPNSVRQKNWR